MSLKLMGVADSKLNEPLMGGVAIVNSCICSTVTIAYRKGGRPGCLDRQTFSSTEGI